MYIASFYRPTNEDPQPLISLNELLSKLSQNGALPIIILGDDLNLPSIDWLNQVVKLSPQYGYRVNRLMLDTVKKHGLQQHDEEPTRLDNILDLLLTTHPVLVEKISVSPSMSDHAVITASVNIKVKINKKNLLAKFIFSVRWTRKDSI